jgi:hypothetical protein
MDKDRLMDRLLERTSRPNAGTASADACLDAATLAAWTDGTLTPAERAAAEQHTADCDRCLAMVAAMARTEPPPAVPPTRAWHSWRWVVPLATASVAITAWIIVREPITSDRPSAPAAADSSVAPEQRPSAAPAQPSARQDAAKAVVAEEKVEKKVDEKMANVDSGTVAERQRAERRADSQVSTRALDSLQRPARDAAATGAGAVAPSTPPAAVPPVSETVGQAARFSALAPVVVMSPDPNMRWRLAGASVERSVDGGKTWQRQATGTTAALVAGSAPGPTICWIIGQAGTVLVTADGQNWRRVTSPDPTADLRTITAIDASRATVSTSDGRTYLTTDGGATWRLQENPPAPF